MRQSYEYRMTSLWEFDSYLVNRWFNRAIFLYSTTNRTIIVRYHDCRANGRAISTTVVQVVTSILHKSHGLTEL